MAKGPGREDKACATRAAIPAFFMLLTAKREARTGDRSSTRAATSKTSATCVQGAIMDRGRPDFTGKLKTTSPRSRPSYSPALFLPPYSPDLNPIERLRQAQTSVASCPTKRRRSLLAEGRRSHQPLRQRRMRQLPSRHLLEWIEGESFGLFCPGPCRCIRLSWA